MASVLLHAGALFYLATSKVALVRQQTSAWPIGSEFELWVEDATQRSTAAAVAPSASLARSTKPASRVEGWWPVSEPSSVGDFQAALVASAEIPRQVAPPASPRARSRPIDLGLAGNIPLARTLEAPPREPRAVGSVARLREELEALDAERGLSRASPVVSAAYHVAGSAPENGTASFEVTTDSAGVVVSVVLVGQVVDRPGWLRVLSDLRQRLKDRRLAVGPAGEGVVVRIRVERGRFAKSPEERFRQRRGAALGEEPAHPGVPQNESTSARLDQGRVRPTFGVGGPVSTPTRVRLLELR